MKYQPEDICPVCNDKEAWVVSDTDGKTREQLITLECKGCGLGRIDPLPGKEILRQWYTEQYRQAYKGAVSPQMRHVLRAARLAKSRWEWAGKRMGLAPNAKTLDIGASSGEFVYLMKKLGFTAIGMEPHLGYGGHAREVLNLQVHAGTLEEAWKHCEPGSCDMLTMFHVFEHVVDPLETLNAVQQLLKPNGYFLIEVPDATKFCAPHTMFFKAHTLYFSMSVMKRILQQSGFKVLDQSAQKGNLLFWLKNSDQTQPSNAHWLSSYRKDELSKAQERRRWHTYIGRELMSMALLKKISKQVEERLKVKNYSNYIELLDDTY